MTNTDRYKIMSKIGSGGFGDVYRCKRQSDKAVIAVKVEFSQLVEERRLEVRVIMNNISENYSVILLLF